MSNITIVIGIAVVAVAIFVVGMSLTLIFKGHHIDSEIGDNKQMKDRGIKCTSQQIREEERAIFGDKDGRAGTLSDDCNDCGSGSCGTCR